MNREVHKQLDTNHWGIRSIERFIINAMDENKVSVFLSKLIDSFWLETNKDKFQISKC